MILGALTSGTLTYRPLRDAKLQITGKAVTSNLGSVLVNGIAAGAAVTPGGHIALHHYVTAGEVITVSATGVDGIVISALEE